MKEIIELYDFTGTIGEMLNILRELEEEFGETTIISTLVNYDNVKFYVENGE